VCHPSKFSGRPILCYVTDRKSLPTKIAPDHFAPLLEQIGGAASAGVDWVQIREKDLSGRQCSLLVREALRQIKKSAPAASDAARLFVNDRFDVAWSEGATGVHLGDHSLPVGELSEWLNPRANRIGGKNLLVGVSCHSVAEAVSAERDGANYIFFGPIFATPSKAAFGPPQGLQRLTEVCKTISIPVLAIGGITRENASSCVDAGAAGLAAIRLFQEAADLVSLVTRLHSVSC
jgi:thiamine-phosphate pyrophosphorylase